MNVFTDLLLEKTLTDEEVTKVFEIQTRNSFGNLEALASTAQFDHLKAKEKGKEEAEIRRLEYVGATRAESVLIIGNYTPKDKGTGAHYNPWGDLLDDNLPLIPIAPNPDDYKKILENVEAETLRSDCCKNEESNKPSYGIKKPSDFKIKIYNDNVTDIDEDKVDVNREKEIINNGIDYESTIVGTMVHRLMELLVNSRNSYSVEDAIYNVMKEFNYPEYENLIANVANKMTGGGCKQNNGFLPDDILTELVNADKVMCELPFAYKENNITVQGIIDCIYLKNNEWTIIDYKTNKENDVSRLSQEYSGQLHYYKKALLNTYQIDAKAKIYHIDVE